MLKKNSAGYSLAEVLISIAVLGLGLLAVAGVFPVAISTLRIIGDRYFVVQQAQAQMEAIKSIQFATLEQIADTSGAITYPVLKDLKQARDPNCDPNSVRTYPGYRSVAPITRDPNDAGVLHIEIEIYWVESNNYGKQSTLEKSYILHGFKSRGIK